VAIKLRLKHSATANKAPLPGDLLEGELALNINNTSPAAYIKDSTGAVVKLAGVGAVGATDATTTAKGVVQLADATAITAGTAGRVVDAAQLKAATDADDWTRTGTTIAPRHAGDVVNISAGTAALPGLTPVGDPNTGLWAPAADTLALSVKGGEALRIDDQKRVGIGTSSPPTAAGGILQLNGGITFPATAVASTDPNTLDDYEEGTWTPTVIGTGTAGTATYGTRFARYTKVGRLVFIELRLSWSAGTGTGDLRISGLPFTAAGETFAGLSVAFTNILTLTANHVATSRVLEATTEIQVLSYPTGGGTNVNVAYDAAAQIGLAGCYTV
jgi:hypothetical protein